MHYEQQASSFSVRYNLRDHISNILFLTLFNDSIVCKPGYSDSSTIANSFDFSFGFMTLIQVVIFCFSKNRCDKSADSMYATDLTSNSEKREIRVFCDKAFSRLKGSDRSLPQVKSWQALFHYQSKLVLIATILAGLVLQVVRIQSLLRRGIGVHHAGLLPIVKEVVEMLFCRGVIKVIFSGLLSSFLPLP